MKKIYLAAMAVAALTVSSCSQDEVLIINPEAGAKAIEFGVYTGKAAQTRSTETTTATVAANGFGVSAVWTQGTATGTTYSAIAPNFMYNEQVKGTETSSGSGTYTWKYDPVKYWPTNTYDVVSFFAYAPYLDGTTVKTDNTGITIPKNTEVPNTGITYTLNETDPSKNADFVAAAVYNKGQVQQTEPENVSFEFKHELTKIDIKAKLSQGLTKDINNTSSATKVIITDISFYGTNNLSLYSAATYTYATSDNAHGSWAGTSDKTITKTSTDAGYSVMKLTDSQNHEIVKANETNNIKAVNIEGLDISSYTTMNTIFKPTTEGKKSQYLFLIPPASTNGIGTLGDIKMDISYTIATADNELDSHYVSTPTTKTISLPVGLLAQGKAYTFEITVDIDDVAFTVETIEWDENLIYTTEVDDTTNEPGMNVKTENP